MALTTVLAPRIRALAVCLLILPGLALTSAVLGGAGLVFSSGPAFAVQPGEMLADPALEARARAISRNLRCLVCRNESIDESNADLARDMRIVLRERILEGDSDDEVYQYFVDRYGEFVLLRPQMGGVNMVLWIAAPVMFVIALGMAIVYLRRRESAPEADAKGLSDAESKRLREILEDGDARS